MREQATAAIAVSDLELTARHLAELGHAGAALAAAMAGDDLVGALAAAHESRRQRAELARHPLPDSAGDADTSDLAALGALVAGGRLAATIVDAWRQRPLPPPGQLMRSPLGVACLVDDLLPATWDSTRDLVILVGGGLEAAAEHLLDLGQQRVLALVSTPESAKYPAGVTVVADVTEVRQSVHTMQPCPPERVAVRTLEPRDRDLAAETAEAARTALGDLRVHHNTVSAFARTWITQGTTNLDAIARWPSVADLGDRLAGAPMIVCAPGPSLAKNLDRVRDAKGKAVIVAVSHALRPLRAAGVVPDVVVAVDPQDVRYHYREGDLDGVTALVNGVTVHPALFELPGPRCLTLASNGGLDSWLYGAPGAEPVVVAGGGSVATTALSLGLRWRCDPIIMVGLDLSFAGGRYYVDTSVDGKARAVVAPDGTMAVAGWSESFHQMKAAGGPPAGRERLVELPGWHGEPVPSSFMFAMFHRWFVEAAARVEGTVRLVNATEGGVFIAGMEHLPLAEVVAGLTAPVDVAAAVDGACASIDVEARRQRVASWRTKARADLARAARLARLALKLSEHPTPKSMRRLERVERELVGVLADHAFAALPAQRSVEAALDEARRPATAEEYLRASRALFAAAATTCGEVADALDRTDPARGHRAA
ncbi:MAG TPA: 6-hydroxymethylpterin diphosphokinase MptE-like protein [Kofleriaceae bacterium]|nr:6-hydroxymethylpterin diphosphokinase MptE-like protein [Kofleriaceae bacterium]